MDFVRLDRADAVVTAHKESGCWFEDRGTLRCGMSIPSGHKVATQAMAHRGSGAQICAGHRLCFLFEFLPGRPRAYSHIRGLSQHR